MVSELSVLETTLVLAVIVKLFRCAIVHWSFRVGLRLFPKIVGVRVVGSDAHSIWICPNRMRGELLVPVD